MAKVTLTFEDIEGNSEAVRHTIVSDPPFPDADDDVTEDDLTPAQLAVFNLMAPVYRRHRAQELVDKMTQGIVDAIFGAGGKPDTGTDDPEKN